MDIKDYTTTQLDDIMAGRVDWVNGADEEFEERSAVLNEKLDKEGGLTFTKEEVATGDYKALSPHFNDFNFKDGICTVKKLNYWDDASYMAYQTEC